MGLSLRWNNDFIIKHIGTLSCSFINDLHQALSEEVFHDVTTYILLNNVQLLFIFVETACCKKFS